ncbi:MAG: nucleotide-binding protein [Planctomycetota bacterium]|jgi:CO dehydrogenase maturation factor
MTTTIAISGKGGSGKTTLAAMIIRRLIEQGGGAVLAVDADPNSCLGLTLGIEPVGIVADIRENVRSKEPANTGMDRVRTVEYGIQQAITESEGFDLLTMGRPEGPDCYCAVNNMLRKFLDNLGSRYRYVVIDNEAGMEHLSRRTTNNVDLLCIVAEPNPIGSITVRRISDLAGKLPIGVKKLGVIWNKVLDQSDSDTRDYLVDEVETFGYVPSDPTVFENSIRGKTVFELAKDSPAYSAMDNILESVLTLCSSS